MWKRLLLALSAVLLLAIIGWLAAVRGRQLQLHDSLARAVRMYNIGYASQIEVGAFTDFDWDLLHVFGPYANRESVNQVLGFDWPGARFLSFNLRNDETVCLLVFVNKGEIVRNVEIERAVADFAGLADGSPYSPGEARFFVLPESQTTLGLMETP